MARLSCPLCSHPLQPRLERGVLLAECPPCRSRLRFCPESPLLNHDRQPVARLASLLVLQISRGGAGDVVESPTLDASRVLLP